MADVALSRQVRVQLTPPGRTASVQVTEAGSIEPTLPQGPVRVVVLLMTSLVEGFLQVLVQPVPLATVTSEQERSNRRFKELTGKGIDTTYAAVLADMVERDKRDSERSTAPLKPAADAHILDTSTMSEGEVMERALSIIRGHIVEAAARR